MLGKLRKLGFQPWVVVATASLFLVGAEGAETKSPLDSLPLSPPCASQAAKALEGWNLVKPDWSRTVDSGPGVRVYATSTDTLGVWIVIEFSEDGKGPVSVYRTTANETTRITWSQPDCESQLQVTPSKETPDEVPEFSDDDLKSLLNEKKQGVIFTWSPYMVLSNLAYPELKKATDKRGLKIVMVMDPAADETTAESQVKRNGWNDSAMKKVTSIEILNRGVANHYPSILVFSNGVLSKRLYPGLKSDEQYGAFIDDELKVVGK